MNDPAGGKVEKNKALVLAAMTEAFIKRDHSAFDRFWAEDYIQHNHYIPPFRAGLRSLVEQLPPEFTYEPGMIIGEGDLVMIHGRYTGGRVGQPPQIIADIFRIADGLLVEHWDVVADEIPIEKTVSGNAMFTNPQATSKQLSA
jgi:predicted SnoaL-like aldol condensation-catalyzing enzyme